MTLINLCVRNIDICGIVKEIFYVASFPKNFLDVFSVLLVEIRSSLSLRLRHNFRSISNSKIN